MSNLPGSETAATAPEVALADAVIKKMSATDTFSAWLGIEILETGPRSSVARMTVRPEMMNGLGGTHGGIVYSLADSAFSYATNSSGLLCVAIDCTVSYPAAVSVGDVLTATAQQESQTNRLAFCAVTVRNQRDVVVGHFRGTVYRTHKPHFPEKEANP
ncbi:MAG: hotdog fold thioesterase [Gemmatimonadota bacterium]|nr:hotdog fold thioesterase [Gemmatimonadota bacterium]